MSILLPYLIIRAPAGTERRQDLREAKYTVGRSPENAIHLPDDAAQRISRFHCELIREGGCWLLQDNSTNGTQVRRQDQTQNVQDLPDRRTALTSADEILIHGWTLTFYDLNRTNPLNPARRPSSPTSTSPFVFKLSQATLFHQTGQSRQPLAIRPQVRDMLCYMAQRNLENQGEPIICEYPDLIRAIWPDEGAIGHTSQDIQKLALEIRTLFKQTAGAKPPNHYLATQKGRGYILHIDCEW